MEIAAVPWTTGAWYVAVAVVRTTLAVAGDDHMASMTAEPKYWVRTRETAGERGAIDAEEAGTMVKAKADEGADDESAPSCSQQK